MGLRVSSAAGASLAATTPARQVVAVLRLVRYRFFLYAGLLPYLLGAAWAWAVEGRFDPPVFWSGLAGVVLAVVGVEAFNEYFDAQMGTDRVFNPADLPPVTATVFWIGAVAFAGALAVGVYLTVHGGWPILAFALLGGAAAIFYEAPPIRWSYRGLGEAVIALAYGPWMVMGSVYLHTGTLPGAALLASCVPGLLIMSLAVVNAIPDFQQDRLVGKRNLVVRLGRARAVKLYLGLAATALVVVVAGVAARVFPLACAAALVALPWLVASAARARTTYEQPRRFLPAIRSIILCYVIAVGLFGVGVLLARPGLMP
jgi:1,4-dihydroxy-2-naphthoate octaprenyltransferase